MERLTYFLLPLMKVNFRTMYVRLLSILLVLPITLYCQNGQPQMAGARGAALANASVSFQDINAAFSNQAGLAYVDRFSVLAYGERRFMGLNQFSFAAALPSSELGTFGLSVQHLGIADFSEQKVGLAYARKLSKRLAMGAQFDYLSLRIPNYGVARLLTFELGLQAEVSDRLRVGAHVYSPMRVRIGEEQVLPTVLKIGGSYQPSADLQIFVELEQDMEYPLRAKVGLEYQPNETLYLRLGIATSPTLASFGLGLNLGALQLDFSTSYHQLLGITPSVGLCYQLPKED